MTAADAVKAEAERPLVGTKDQNGVIDPDVLWSCTTCGACVEQCPVDIEHVDHIMDMRRYQVLVESQFPTELGGVKVAFFGVGPDLGGRRIDGRVAGRRGDDGRCVFVGEYTRHARSARPVQRRNPADLQSKLRRLSWRRETSWWF